MIAMLLAAALAASPTPKPATNAKCPVMGGKVNPAKAPKVTVRGQEYFLCCKGCDKKLQADPDKYLEKDGTPKNTNK